MRHHRLINAWWMALVFTFFSASSVCAFPPLPSSFYGTVQQDGENIPDGTLVEALIEGEVRAYSLSETYQGTSVFSLDIPGDDPATDKVEGGTPGQTIQFRVGGVLAEQTDLWKSGVNQQLDLTLGAGKELAPRLPTFTPVPSQTPIPKATVTPMVTEEKEEHSGEIEPTAEADPTNTPMSLSTHTTTQTDQEGQSEVGSNEADGNSDPSNPYPTGTAMAVSSSNEREAASGSMDAQGDTTQAESEKNNTDLWIGLTILLLISVLAVVLVLRRKHGNEMDSSLI